MQDRPEVVCVAWPESMGEVLAAHYADRPLSQLPSWAVKRYAARWRERSDVYYVEARTEAGDYLGFIFGHTLGERPWRKLFSDPPCLMPIGTLALITNRLRRRLTSRPVLVTAEEETVSREEYSQFDPGLLNTAGYYKTEYVTVLADQRGKGIATRLHTALEEVLRTVGCPMMSSTISSHNMRSVKAHQRSGFDVYRQSPSTFRTIKLLRKDNQP